MISANVRPLLSPGLHIAPVGRVEVEKTTEVLRTHALIGVPEHVEVRIAWEGCHRLAWDVLVEETPDPSVVPDLVDHLLFVFLHCRMTRRGSNAPIIRTVVR